VKIGDDGCPNPRVQTVTKHDVVIWHHEDGKKIKVKFKDKDPFEWFATDEKKDYVVFGRVEEEPSTYEYGAGIDDGADCPDRTGPKIIVEG